MSGDGIFLRLRADGDRHVVTFLGPNAARLCVWDAARRVFRPRQAGDHPRLEMARGAALVFDRAADAVRVLDAPWPLYRQVCDQGTLYEDPGAHWYLVQRYAGAVGGQSHYSCFAVEPVTVADRAHIAAQPRPAYADLGLGTFVEKTC